MALEPPSSQDPILRIHCVKVFVRDQEQSLRFYVDQLGFRLVADTVLQSGERWVAVAPPDGDTVLVLMTPEPDSKLFQLIGRPTDVVFATDDVLARYREWSQRGVKFLSTPKLRRVKSVRGNSIPSGIEPPVWGGVFTHFKDLDGNSFSLVSLDEVTQAIEGERRAKAERAEAERRVAQEMEIAKQVQARLFPQGLPALRTLEYAGTCQQARQVGGDYYDFLATSGERLCVVIGDVAGKGIGAALLMANLQAILRSQCVMGIDEPAQLMQSVNRLFYESTPENAYATFFFSEYNDRTGRLRYANCGHLPALVVRAGGELERLESTATVLGRFSCWECSVGETSLCAGDTLALYTDGVTEAGSMDGDEFGEQRLLECLKRHRDLSSSDMVSATIEAVHCHSPHEQHDDITLIVAKCHFDQTSDQMGLPYEGRA
ncbi:MAG TPA: SpoIIE family protein phosphatase [Terriglobales bacterium]|nr:SpoIIE family protein phosphatase [Terriglobales bacterium]